MSIDYLISTMYLCVGQCVGRLAISEVPYSNFSSIHRLKLNIKLSLMLFVKAHEN